MATVAGIRDGSTVYLDTAPLIYVVEEHPEFAAVVEPLLTAVNAGRIRAVSSYVTLLEILVKPLQEERADLAKSYQRILTSSPHLRLLPLDGHVALEAARIRATAGVRLADAVHLATAKLTHVDAFVTNDEGLKRFKELRILTVSELAAQQPPDLDRDSSVDDDH